MFPKLPPYSLPRPGKFNEQNLMSKFNIDFELFGGQNEPNKTEFPFLEKAWENKSERRYSKTRNLIVPSPPRDKIIQCSE